jgi:galactitol-specific phosphotransferase system IIB component
MANFTFQCIKRDNVNFYLFESPDPLVLFSFHLPLSFHSKTLLLLDVNNGGLRLNGIQCEDNQFALISEQSQLPFCFQIPAHSPILVCDVKSDNKKFNQLCHSMVPVNIDINYAQELKEVAKKIGFEAEIDHEDLSSAASSNADIWVAATDIAVQLEDAGKQNIIRLKNIFDKASIEEQLKAFM